MNEDEMQDDPQVTTVSESDPAHADEELSDTVRVILEGPWPVDSFVYEGVTITKNGVELDPETADLAVEAGTKTGVRLRIES